MGEFEKVLEKQRLYEEALEKKAKAERRLKWAKRATFLQAITLFRFPFGKGAFAALGQAIVVLLCTIIFSGVAMPVVIATVFCAVVDLLALVLYVPVFPFAWLILAVTKKARVARWEEKLAEEEKALSRFDPVALAEEIKRLRPKTTSVGSSSSGVENTEWFKRKQEEHFDRYMGRAPRERKYGWSEEELKKHDDIVENQ